VPDFVLDSSWVYHGRPGTDFEKIPGTSSELWSWTSQSPRGICLALPRWETLAVPEVAKAFGVICQGFDSSKACFWDNRLGSSPMEPPKQKVNPMVGDPGGAGYLLDSQIFVGGAELATNVRAGFSAPLICSDCHAGGNAFVVHPEDQAFEHLLQDTTRKRRMKTASRWYEPIVPSGWPRNLRRERRLAGTMSTASCAACHRVGHPEADELPEVSYALSGFCSVLRSATARPPVVGQFKQPTMPSPAPVSQAAHDQFKGHIDALDSWCNISAPTAKGQIVNSEAGYDDVGHISPPVVRSPLFTCGEGVEVGGFVPGAKVTLVVTSTSGASTTLSATTSDTDSRVDFALPQPLSGGDTVKATQEWNGISSGDSQPVIAADYPDNTGSLPAPTFDGDEVYSCTDSISVRSIPGSSITVTHQGVTGVSGAPGNGWLLVGVFSPAPWPTPWQNGDRFEAQARLECMSGGQVHSWVSPSTMLRVQPPPSVLNQPTFEPAQAYEGQTILGLRNVTYGSFSVVTRSVPAPAIGLGRTVAAPDGWGANLDVRTTPLGRPVALGERFTANASLSCSGLVSVSVTTPEVRPCSEMPPPEVAAPKDGDRFVIVLQSMPGARIRVFRGVNTEIGDGQGPVVGLSSPVMAGEDLKVTQTAGTCSNDLAFQIRVLGGM
jgi:hypothetical protein